MFSITIRRAATISLLSLISISLLGTANFAMAATGTEKTSTSVFCDQGTAVVNELLSCTIMVNDVGPNPSNPEGHGLGLFVLNGGTPIPHKCVMEFAFNAASCNVDFTPRSTGSLIIVGIYSGDSRHAPSADTITVPVASGTS